MEITDKDISFVKKLKSILTDDGIIVDGPYIINSFHYFSLGQYNDWNEWTGDKMIISDAIKYNKPKSWKTWNKTWDPPIERYDYKTPAYVNDVFLLAIEIKIIIK